MEKLFSGRLSLRRTSAQTVEELTPPERNAPSGTSAISRRCKLLCKDLFKLVGKIADRSGGRSQILQDEI